MKKWIYSIFLLAATCSMVACEYNPPVSANNNNNSDAGVSKPTLYIGKWVNQSTEGTKILNFSSEMGTSGSVTFLDAGKAFKTIERFNSYIVQTVGDTISDVRFENKSSSCTGRTNLIFKRTLNVQGTVLIMSEYNASNNLVRQLAFTRPSAELEGSLSIATTNAFETCLTVNY